MSNYLKVKKEAERIKSDFAILDYFHGLVGKGILKYEGIQGKEFFFGFPDQRTGSIAVNDQTNLWFDHSRDKGGDIIEAVQFFENKTFFQAVNSFSRYSPIESTIVRKKSENINKIELVKAIDISHNALVTYVQSRGLDPNEIAPFAKEVHWRNGDKRYFAIGFQNDSGGWILRSSVYKGNIFAGGISSQTVGSGGRTKIFEGWFDFLSYLKLSNATDFNAVILNSTANLSLRLMLEILMNNDGVDLYLDNDGAGEDYTKEFIRIAQLSKYCETMGLNSNWDVDSLRGNKNKVEQLISILNLPTKEIDTIWKLQTTVTDQRNHYLGFEDVNAFLIGKRDS